MDLNVPDSPFSPAMVKLSSCSCDQHNCAQFSWNVHPSAPSLQILIEMHLLNLTQNCYSFRFDYISAQKQRYQGAHLMMTQMNSHSSLLLDSAQGEAPTELALGRLPANKPEISNTLHQNRKEVTQTSRAHQPGIHLAAHTVKPGHGGSPAELLISCSPPA